MSRFETISERMKEILELKSEPVGVLLLPGIQYFAPFEGYRRLESHRYCQSLMRARRGERVLLDADGLACPAAAAGVCPSHLNHSADRIRCSWEKCNSGGRWQTVPEDGNREICQRVSGGPG